MLRPVLIALTGVALLAASARAADVAPITLRAAIDRALAANRDLRQADALVTGAEAGMRIAGV
jgi:outer membrane protein TolC